MLSKTQGKLVCLLRTIKRGRLYVEDLKRLGHMEAKEEFFFLSLIRPSEGDRIC